MKASKTFQTEIQIRFREADPAGILFFGHVFALAHDCFEGFIEETGFGWKNWFNVRGEYLVPIRHTEANYLRPFFAGQRYQITAQVQKLGETSFQMHYVFSQNGSTHAEVSMVHAFMDAKTKQKMPVPASVKEKLTPYLVNS